MVNINETIPKLNLPTEICVKGESCGNCIFPNKYIANTPNMAIQIDKNTSRSNQCNCNTKSAFDKNLNAKANSKNPNTTFTVFNQPPDLGKEFNQPGNAANNANGMAKANENPNIPTIGPI